MGLTPARGARIPHAAHEAAKKKKKDDTFQGSIINWMIVEAESALSNNIVLPTQVIIEI